MFLGREKKHIHTLQQGGAPVSFTEVYIDELNCLSYKLKIAFGGSENPVVSASLKNTTTEALWGKPSS
jgi:hypothetical protein